ncbi:hypothetical protein BpHYR1_019086, partial [Brachionus plicatilis]
MNIREIHQIQITSPELVYPNPTFRYLDNRPLYDIRNFPESCENKKHILILAYRFVNYLLIFSSDIDCLMLIMVKIVRIKNVR